MPSTGLSVPSFTSRRLFIVIIVVALLLTSGGIFFAVNQTKKAITAARATEFEAAADYSRQALFIVEHLSFVTLHSIKSVEAWQAGLSLLSRSPTVTTLVSDLNQMLLQPGESITSPSTTQNTLTLTMSDLNKLEDSIAQSKLLTLYPPTSKILKLLSETSSALIAVDYYLQGNHELLILLQNTDEIRPTGGFMGSFAEIHLSNGQVQSIEIQDIYQPDGQIEEVLTPPAGVSEYLSEGRGWRLPDTNWHPDFSVAAQDILAAFALGKRQGIDALVAVNLPVLENLLSITGPIFLPDYQVTVDHSNLAQIARSEREYFFPGSQQKPEFLESLFNHLKFKLAHLSSEQQLQIAQTLFQALDHKNIQFYSNEPKVQAAIQQNNWGGTLPMEPFIFLLEANVGINKANRNVHREVQLKIEQSQMIIEAIFTNQNIPERRVDSNALIATADHLHYVNYQRIILPAQVQVSEVTANGKPIKWTTQTITSFSGSKYLELGFLVTVPEQATTTIVVTISNFPSVDTLTLVKQSGLSPVPYTISSDQQSQNLILEKNTAIPLK